MLKIAGLYCGSYYPFIAYYSYIHFNAIKILQEELQNKKITKHLHNDCLCPLKLFCGGMGRKWLVWVQNSNLKQFLGMNE